MARRRPRPERCGWTGAVAGPAVPYGTGRGRIPVQRFRQRPNVKGLPTPFRERPPERTQPLAKACRWPHPADPQQWGPFGHPMPWSGSGRGGRSKGDDEQREGPAGDRPGAARRQGELRPRDARRVRGGPGGAGCPPGACQAREPSKSRRPDAPASKRKWTGWARRDPGPRGGQGIGSPDVSGVLRFVRRVGRALLGAWSWICVLVIVSDGGDRLATIAS